MSRWYELNGGWIPDKDRYPGGIGELRDYCHEKGMKFGLWMEPERPGAASAVYKEHPEWFTENFDSSRGALLDFTVPKAAQWAESECVRVIEQYGVDLFRVDYNIVTPRAFHRPPRRSGRHLRRAHRGGVCHVQPSAQALPRCDI